MRIAIPIEVEDANISSSNLLEDDHLEWDESTSYLIGDNVIVISTHRIYEALTDNLGESPIGETGEVDWLDVGATNKWKPFDEFITDQAINSSGDTIEYVFTGLSVPANSVSCFGLSGRSISLTVTDPLEGEVYSEEISLVDTSLVVDAFTYCFDPSRIRTEAVFAEIPPYASADFELTLTDEIDDPKVGQIVLGQEYDVGLSKYGTSISIEDYSKKDRDQFGNAIIVERPFAKLVDFDFSVPTERARRTAILLEQIRATPAVYFAGLDTDQYGTTVYGYWRKWRVTLDGPTFSDATLEVEGLT